jgi:multidrug efflux system membrane fusion protein
MFERIINSCFFLCLLSLSLPFLSGCMNKSGAAGGAGAAGVPKPEVIVDTVGKDDVQIYIYAEGRTVPSNSVEIRSRVSGYLEKLFFEPGAIVKEGDRLTLVEQATYQIALDAAKAELSNAEARASLAKANLDRARVLLERQTIAAEEFQTQQANYDIALAAVELAKASIRSAELNLQYTDMRSPITGKTTKNLVDIGNYVNPTGSQAVLLSITQLDPMYVEFKLNDRQFSDLKDRIGFRDAFNEAISTSEETAAASNGEPLALTGMPVDVSLMTGVNVFNFDFDISGKVVAVVDNQINWSTANITLRAEIQNPLLQTDGAEDYLIYPGQVCRVRIPYETVQDALLIREEAILTDLDTKYVLVVAKGMFQPTDASGKPLLDENGQEIQPYEADIVHRRDIKIGRLLDTQMRIVLNGLQPGESYIVHGVQRVRIGAAVQPTTLADHNARRAAESAR